MSAIELGPIHEPDRRRPSLLDGPRIRLRNGEHWMFARPRVVFAVGDAEQTLAPRLSFGHEWSPIAQDHDKRLIEGLDLFSRIASRIDTPAGLPSDEVYRGLVVTIAFQMLQRNYRLDYDEGEELLIPEPGEPGAATLIQEVIDATLLGPYATLRRALNVLPDDPCSN